jgi:hypothetical protein
MSNVEEPAVITLNDNNAVEILSKYVEVAQQKGAFLLQEAEILKRSCDVLLNFIIDQEINVEMAKQLLIQGAVKGQRHGAYTLNDASLLHKVVQFITNSLQAAAQPAPQSAPQSAPQPAAQPTAQVPEDSEPQESSEDNYDLSDLAEPIPLKPKEV